MADFENYNEQYEAFITFFGGLEQVSPSDFVKRASELVDKLDKGNISIARFLNVIELLAGTEVDDRYIGGFLSVLINLLDDYELVVYLNAAGTVSKHYVQEKTNIGLRVIGKMKELGIPLVRAPEFYEGLTEVGKSFLVECLTT